MVTQGEFDQLARRVTFLEKDNARLADRVKVLEAAECGRYPMPVIDNTVGVGMAHQSWDYLGRPMPLGGQHVVNPKSPDHGDGA